RPKQVLPSQVLLVPGFRVFSQRRHRAARAVLAQLRSPRERLPGAAREQRHCSFQRTRSTWKQGHVRLQIGPETASVNHPTQSSLLVGISRNYISCPSSEELILE